MKFTASSVELNKALGIISGVVPTRSTLPILENVLFQLTKNSLRISGTDLEVSISVRLEVAGEKDGAIAIPAKRLLETVRSLPDLDITFSADIEENRATLKTKNGKYTLMGQNALDFPEIPTGMTGTNIAMPSAALKKAIGLTVFAVSEDELRPAMTGVLFQFRNTEMKMVATDGHRLVRLRSKGLPATNLTRDIIVPSKALALVSRPSDESETTVTVDTKHVQFTTGATTITSRLIDETYPNFESVIPLDNDKTLTLNRETALAAIRRVALYSSTATHQIRLTLKKNETVFSANDLDFGGEANETVESTYDAPEMEIGFNSRYVIDIFSRIDAENVVMTMSTPLRAAVVTPAGQSEEDVMMLVMPIRLNT